MPLTATDAGRACNWLHVLVSIPPITQASIAEAELGINQVTMTDKMGASSPLRRALAGGLKFLDNIAEP